MPWLLKGGDPQKAFSSSTFLITTCSSFFPTYSLASPLYRVVSLCRLRLLKRGDPSENMFFQYLIEDRSSAGMSYVEFLVYVHRQIQNKMG